MVQMLGEGSEAMQKAAEDAKFLGLVVDKDAAAKAKLFNDSLGRLTGSIKGVSRGIAGKLMPLFSGLADRLADSLARNRENISTFIESSIENFFVLGEIINQVFARMKEVMTDKTAFKDFVAGLTELVKLSGERAVLIGRFILTGIKEGLKIGLKAIFRAGVDLGNQILDGVKFVLAGGLADLFKELAETVGNGIAKIGDRIAKAIKFVKTGKAKEAIQDLGDDIKENLGEVGQKAVEAMAETMNSTIKDDIKGSIDVLKSEFDNLTAGLKDNFNETGQVIAETFGVNLDAAREKAISTIESLSLFAETTKEKIQETGATVTEFMQLLQEQQLAFTEWLNQNNLEFLETMRETAQATIENISAAMASAIVEGQNLQQSLRAIAKSVIKEVVAALIKMGIQRLILSKINLAATKTDATAEASKAVGLAGANMFASWAGAPWPISIAAPAAAAAAITGAASAFASGAAAGAAAGSVIGHGGLTNNPKEQTATIIQGERIVSPRQNRDLTNFLDGQQGGSGVNIDRIEIVLFPNATNADAIFEMDPQTLSDALTPAVIDGLNRAFRDGIQPDFADRND